MNYESYTVKELQQMARDRNQPTIARIRKKGDIVNALKRVDAQEIEYERRRVAEEAAEEAHRATRQVGLQKQTQEIMEDSVGSLEYPFSFLRNGEYARECEQIPGQPEEDIGNFPDNIAEYFWIRPGENDEFPWLMLCRLQNGVYVYYRGECDYTGFDCQGDMKIYASNDPNILIKYAMTSADYDLYVEDVVVCEH